MKIITPFILSLCFILSCSKEKRNNIIVNDIEIKSCLPYNQDKLTIISKEEYEALKQESGCDGGTFPEIDFDQYSVLGFFVAYGCREPKRIVLKDDANKSYHFKVYVKKTLFDCKAEYANMMWAVVPKLPTDYTVNYEVIH